MKKKIITNILLVIFIGIFIYSAYMCFIWFKSDRETRKLEEGLYSEVVLKVDETEENEENTNTNKNEIEEKIDFDKLLSINDDVIGWIKIDNTYINYPILQEETEEYYLRKDIYKKYSVSGSIFVDSTTNPEFYDHNTVIYGHNMKNERMFADLHKIKNGTLGTDINVKIYIKDTSNIYKVFSAYVSEPIPEIATKNFTDETEKENYINNAIKRSNVKFVINKENINYENDIITLITCDNNNKYRVIVHAIKI